MTAGLFAAAAVVAVLALGAGVAKIVRPHDTAVALGAVLGRSVHVPDALVRAGAGVEVLIAAGALAGSRPALLALAASYAGFAVFVGAALMSGRPVSSCGCFGEPDVPPTRLHVVFDLVVAAAVGLLATTPGPLPSLAAMLRHQPFAGVPFVLLVVLAAGAAYLVLGELPKLQAAVAAVVTAREDGA